MKPTYLIAALFICFFLKWGSILAQDSSRVVAKYGSKGFEWNTTDGNFRMYISSRFQFRYATPFDGNPIIYSTLNHPSRQEFGINSANLRIGGHAYKPFIKYYIDYGLAKGRLLDSRVMIEKWQALRFKVGQWKINYNREHIVSSGKQQLMGRSLVDTYFTLGRQQGVAIYGNPIRRGAANFSYELSILAGAGRSALVNPTNDLMYVGHLQWNFLGAMMPVMQSDTKIHRNPVGEIGFSSAAYKGPYTRFSSSGGGNFLNLSDTVSKLFEVRQANVETAFIYRGFSWQNETHIKLIDNLNTGKKTRLGGVYFQAGYFFHQAFSIIPPQLELAVRYAAVSPDLDQSSNLRQEYSVAVNCFFRDHGNKLTAEYSTLVYEDPFLGSTERGRFRLQWQIVF